MEGSLLPSHKLYGRLDQDPGLKHRREEAEVLELTVSWDLRRAWSLLTCGSSHWAPCHFTLGHHHLNMQTGLCVPACSSQHLQHHKNKKDKTSQALLRESPRGASLIGFNPSFLLQGNRDYKQLAQGHTEVSPSLYTRLKSPKPLLVPSLDPIGSRDSVVSLGASTLGCC